MGNTWRIWIWDREKEEKADTFEDNICNFILLYKLVEERTQEDCKLDWWTVEIDQSTSPDLKVAPDEHIQEIQTKYKNYNM